MYYNCYFYFESLEVQVIQSRMIKVHLKINTEVCNNKFQKLVRNFTTAFYVLVSTDFQNAIRFFISRQVFLQKGNIIEYNNKIEIISPNSYHFINTSGS